MNKNLFICFFLFYRSATSTATSLSSSNNITHLHDHSRSQLPSSSENSVRNQNLTSSGSNNVQNKTNSGGRYKDAGRPDLLAMTPSRNASINSNTSSPQSHSKHCHRYYESRLKDHINQLKSERASLQQQLEVQNLADILSNFHLDFGSLNETSNVLTYLKENTTTTKSSEKVQKDPHLKLPTTTLHNEEYGLTSAKLSKEQEADLHAQLYLISQEKQSLEMKLDDRHSLESMLRSHIEHLREENDRLSRGEGRLSSLSREDKLGKRVDSLLETLDRVTKNSEQRQIHSDELLGDLKRANK